MARGDYQRASSTGGRNGVHRRLAAILGADVTGYSALMARAEEDTHRRVGLQLDRVFREIEKSHGRVFSLAGDGLMAEFPSAVGALRCALRVQAESAQRNAPLSPEQRIIFRIGINSGEIMLQKGRTGGNTVNIAARLEQIAESGGIAVSEAVFAQVRRTVTAEYAYFGEQRLKNIRDPVTIYTIPPTACAAWAGMPVLPRLTAPGAAGAAADYRPSLAVLPFRTLQSDQSDAYFAEGMVDDIIRALGGLKDLLVIARSSTQEFARAPLDLRRVGHELDVRYVLHGSVRRSGDSLRIAVELSEAQTGTIVWVDRFDGGIGDLFDLQDHIAMRVAASVAPHLRDRELSRAVRKHPDSMTAYDLTLKALDRICQLNRESFSEAHALLKQAVEHDPNYALAYSQIAYLHTIRVAQGWSENALADGDAAREAARLAIERDPNDALALAIYGYASAYLRKEYLLAMEYQNRAVAAGPSCAWAWGLSSLTCGYLGDAVAAVERAEQAVRLSPVGQDAFWLEHFLSQAYYTAGRYEDAVAWGRASDAHRPGHFPNLRCLIASLVAQGEVDDAARVASRLLSVDPSFRLSMFQARTPLVGSVKDRFVGYLRQAGLPD